MPNGTYGGVRGERDFPLLDFYNKCWGDRQIELKNKKDEHI